MDDVISIQVVDQAEGESLISYLSSLEVWVTPFVITEGKYYYVKAAIPVHQLEQALMYVRQEA